MTAPTQKLRRAGSAGHSLSIVQLNALRATLVRDRQQETARLLRYAAELVGLFQSASVTASQDRATAALHMYGARNEIEQLEAAVVRIEEGTYGMCVSCNEQMTFERLRSRPQSRTCADCVRRGCHTAGNEAAVEHSKLIG